MGSSVGKKMSQMEAFRLFVWGPCRDVRSVVELGTTNQVDHFYS